MDAPKGILSAGVGGTAAVAARAIAEHLPQDAPAPGQLAELAAWARMAGADV